jgi:cell division protein FtsL
LYKFLYTGIGLAVIIAISVPLARNMSKQYEINQEIEKLQAEIDRLDTRNDDLQELIGYLKTDQYIDERARQGLNFKRPGEQVIVIKQGDAATSSLSRETTGQYIYDVPDGAPAEESYLSRNPARWWNYFFNNS